MGSQSLSLSATSSMDFKLLALSFLLAGVLAVTASPINDDTELLKETAENEALEDDLNQLNDEDDREDDNALEEDDDDLDELAEDRLDEDDDQQPLDVNDRGFFSKMKKRTKKWRRTYKKVRSYWDMYRGYRRDTGFRRSWRNRALKVSAGSGSAKASLARKKDNEDVAEEAAKFADQIEKLEMEIESGIARDQDVQ